MEDIKAEICEADNSIKDVSFKLIILICYLIYRSV